MDEYILEHDVSNALILPASKSKKKQNATGLKETKNAKNKSIKTKEKELKISHKAARRSKRLNELQKKRAAGRSLWKDLQSCQASSSELELYSSITDVNRRRRNERKERKDAKPFSQRDTVDVTNAEVLASGQLSAPICLRIPVIIPVPSSASISEVPQPPVTSLNSSLNSNSSHSPANDAAGQKPKENHSLPTLFVPVFRSKEIQTFRYELPIMAEESTIMETVNANDVVIICGETGSGKTTQVPQFLYEAGFTLNGGIVGITEPRRVAAIAMAERVKLELAFNASDHTVAYQIRFEGTATKSTKILFMTDGVLLREVKEDFLLTRYSVVILDEAHERSVYTDILIGLLSRIQQLRKKRNERPLKLIIMSATLRTDDFMSTRLFKTPPAVVHIGSRQFPVTIYFNRVTHDDYVMESYKKASQIHRLLPEGGILIFVTSQQEVHQLVALLKHSFPLKAGRTGSKFSVDDGCHRKSGERKRQRRSRSKNVVCDTVKDLPKVIVLEDFDSERADFADDDVTNAPVNPLFDVDEENDQVKVYHDHEPLFCLPLYSMLPTSKQQRVFAQPPPNCRLCVVATNVAETSLTIPNIRYVIDTGKEKTRAYDAVTGISRFLVQWTSKASANQRAGRAGRTSAGHCYRLYSSAVFQNDFPQFAVPDIITKPAEELVLHMKTLGITHVSRFPFPTPPDAESLNQAEQRLVKLGILEYVDNAGCPISIDETRDLNQGNSVTAVTELGRSVSRFPLHPCYGKILALGFQNQLMPYVVCLVSALSVREPLMRDVPAEDVAVIDGSSNAKRTSSGFQQIRKRWAGSGESLLFGDLGVLLKAVGAAEFENMQPEFCETYGLRVKAMVEIRKLRKQLTELINAITPANNSDQNSSDIHREIIFESKLMPPMDAQIRQLRQLVLSGLAENVARRTPDSTVHKGRAYFRPDMKDPIFIHPSSVLCKVLPEFVLYQETIDVGKKKYMHNCMAIEPEWLPIYAKNYCTISPAPTDSDSAPAACYNREIDTVLAPVCAKFGPSGWTLPQTMAPAPLDMTYYRLLSEAFLEGQVFDEFLAYRQRLLFAPSIITKRWAQSRPQVNQFLASIISKSIKNRKDFLRAWKEDQLFLLNEYCCWLPESLHDDVRAAWPFVKL